MHSLSLYWTVSRFSHLNVDLRDFVSAVASFYQTLLAFLHQESVVLSVSSLILARYTKSNYYLPYVFVPQAPPAAIQTFAGTKNGVMVKEKIEVKVEEEW